MNYTEAVNTPFGTMFLGWPYWVWIVGAIILIMFLFAFLTRR